MRAHSWLSCCQNMYLLRPRRPWKCSKHPGGWNASFLGRKLTRKIGIIPWAIHCQGKIFLHIPKIPGMWKVKRMTRNVGIVPYKQKLVKRKQSLPIPWIPRMWVLGTPGNCFGTLWLFSVIPCQKGTLLPIPQIPGKWKLWGKLSRNIEIIPITILCQQETSPTNPKIPGMWVLWVLREDVPQQWEQVPCNHCNR